MKGFAEAKARIQAGNAAYRFGKFGGGAGGTNDPWGGIWRMLSGATFDYRREAGIPWENSIVMAGVGWVMRNFPRARIAVQRPTGRQLENGEEEYREAFGHPFAELWNRPNPYYSKSTLWKGLILSRMIDANAFTFVNRSVTGRPVELYYVPHFQISPRWEADVPTFPGESSDYLDRWEYRVDGKEVPWKPNDVFHWRDGIDPQNQRRGLSPLTSVLREIAADNCASTMAAALLRNNNVPGLLVSARQGKDGQSTFEALTPEQEERIKAMAQQKFRGDRAGELMVVPAPVEVSRLSFTPKEMDVSSLRDINEERILAQWGLPLSVAGMGAGLEQTKVGATMKAQIQLAYDQCLIPMQDELAEEMTFWGRREFGAYWQDGERVAFDRSKIAALQDDVNELHGRVRADWMADLTKRSEGRRLLGMAAGPEDEVYFSQVAGKTPTGDAIEPIPNDPEDSDQRRTRSDSPADQEEDEAA